MAITWATVAAIAPELTSVAVEAQTLFLAQAAAEMHVGTWGTTLDVAAPWLAAHLATVARRRGGAGALASERAGDLARAFHPLQGVPWDLGSTAYGLEYLRLARQIPAARFGVSK